MSKKPDFKKRQESFPVFCGSGSKVLENARINELVKSICQNRMEGFFQSEKIIKKIDNFFLKSAKGDFHYYKRGGRTIFKFNFNAEERSCFRVLLRKILHIMEKKDYFLIESQRELTCIFR